RSGSDIHASGPASVEVGKISVEAQQPARDPAHEALTAAGIHHHADPTAHPGTFRPLAGVFQFDPHRHSPGRLEPVLFSLVLYQPIGSGPRRIDTPGDAVDLGTKHFTGYRVEYHFGPIPGPDTTDLVFPQIGTDPCPPGIDEGHCRLAGRDITTKSQ